MYSNQTFRNPLFLKRFSHINRFKLSVSLISPTNSDKILDFGTGDGYILSEIYKKNHNCKIVGYEPLQNEELHSNFSNNKSIEILNKLEQINIKFNKITCFEVLEHLTPENQEKELLNMINLLETDGMIIVSVPIEKGLSSLLKNIIRILSNQKHSNTNLKTIIKSFLGIYLDRGNTSYIHSHIGFYYNDLEKLFDKVGLNIHRKFFSPIKILGPLLNSQIFYILNYNEPIKSNK